MAGMQGLSSGPSDGCRVPGLKLCGWIVSHASPLAGGSLPIEEPGAKPPGPAEGSLPMGPPAGHTRRRPRVGGVRCRRVAGRLGIRPAGTRPGRGGVASTPPSRVSSAPLRSTATGGATGFKACRPGGPRRMDGAWTGAPGRGAKPSPVCSVHAMPCSPWRCSSAARGNIASASGSVNPSCVNCSQTVVTTDAPPYRYPLAAPASSTADQGAGRGHGCDILQL
jgi:hypothetical protein